MTTYEDFAEITGLRADFGRALDTRDWPLFASLLDDELDLDYGEFGGPVGRHPKRALVELFQHAFRSPDVKSQQLYGNFRVEVTGDEATCRSSLAGFHARPGTPGGDEWRIHCTYHDRLTRRNGRWRLSAIRLEIHFMSGNAALVS